MNEQPKIVFIGEGFHRPIYNQSGVSAHLNTFGYMGPIATSFLEEKVDNYTLFILQETRYPYSSYVDVLDKCLDKYNINLNDILFYIFSEHEPRPAAYSFWVPYLKHKYKIDVDKIIYLNATQCDRDSKLDIKVFSEPVLGVKFITNFTPLSSYDPLHECNMYLHLKDKLFSSLVRRLNVSRVLGTAALMHNFDSSEYVMSCGDDTEHTEYIDGKKKRYYDRIAASTGYGLNFVDKLPMRFDYTLDVTYGHGHHFKMFDPALRECVFEVVHETVGLQDLYMEESVMTTDNFFCVTEKAFRHNFNLQIPLFVCRSGFYKFYYETFDLEPHVGIPWEEWDKMDNYHDKVDSIVEFLKEVKANNSQMEILEKNRKIIENNAWKVKLHVILIHIYSARMAERAASVHWEPKKLRKRLNQYLAEQPPNHRKLFQTSNI